MSRYRRTSSRRRKVLGKGENIINFFLPYLPGFNPDERVWTHAKARLSKLIIASKDAMKDVLT